MAAGVVTISATYGASGSLIAPRLAERLGFRFLDRSVSPATAVAAESSSSEEEAANPPSRWIAALARLGATVPGMPAADLGVTSQVIDIRNEATAQVTEAAAQGAAVILGRAGAVVLAGLPLAFHVRLDGPLAARLARAQVIESIDAEEAQRRCDATDRMRAMYVRRLYNRDASDVGLYHLWLDTTVIDVDDAVQLLRDAATAFWRSARANERA